MYLYVNLFNKKALERQKYYLSEKHLGPIIAYFDDYQELKTTDVKGCIGFMMGKENSENKVYLLELDNIVANEKEFSFDFNIQETMDQTNEQIRRNLYRVAALNEWLDEKRYTPNVYILDKPTFDRVRKGQINRRKQSSYTSKIQECKARSDWNGIIKLFEPIGSIKEGHELWSNVNDIYEIGFACSKLGEPQNGKSRDKTHIKEVAKYRNHSIRLFERCIELEPLDFRYLSALAYRYYLNVMELFKQKGRTDGNKDDEIEKAITYLEKAILLNRKSIKDNYRLGKLILEYKIKQMKYKSHKWDRDFFQEFEEVEQHGIEVVCNAISSFKDMEVDRQKNYRKEYIKSCYCLGCYYLQKADLHINEYLMAKISKSNYEATINPGDIEAVANARKYLELCYVAESGNEVFTDLNVEKLLDQQNRWTISPMDILYKLGVVYMFMYYIKNNKSKDLEIINKYKENALKLMNTTYQIASQGKRKKIVKRSTWFINDKYALLHIMDENYADAINLIRNARDGYIMNTLSMAYLFEGRDDALSKSLEKLMVASEDKYNLAKAHSISLMLYIYKIQGDVDKYNELYKIADKSSHKYFECLGVS